MEDTAFVAHWFSRRGFMFSGAELAEILDGPRKSDFAK